MIAKVDPDKQKLESILKMVDTAIEMTNVIYLTKFR